MTGIVAAVAGISANLVFGAGLYQTQPSSAVDLSPIAVGDQTSRFATQSLTYQWQGYLKATTTGTINLGANCAYQEWYDDATTSPFPLNWGGGGDSTCYIWTGATARSGFNTGNFTAFIANGSGSVPFAVTNGTYYPIRVQWSTQLPRVSGFNIFSGNYVYYAISSFAFEINSSSAVSGQIFYNTQTSGF